MHRSNYPKVSPAKKISEIAKKIFCSVKPSNWHDIPIDGDNDFGLDYLIQYRDANDVIKYNFFVQLKGTEDKDKITEKEIKIKLKSSTLNLYRNSSLVLLVVCDITEKKCYYEPLHIILNRLFENSRCLDGKQAEYQIGISRNQVFNEDLDIENILEGYARGIYDTQRKLSIVEELNIDGLFQDTEQDYKYRKEIYQNHYLHEKGRVHVDAYIPYEYDFNISCLILFKLSDTKNVFITPNEKTILEVLFSGYKSKPNSSSRKWIIGAYGNTIIIQIGNSRLNVPVETVIDLSDILDNLFEEYSLRINNFEDKLCSKKFPPSRKYQSAFRLVKIKRGLWYYIHQFASEHGFRDGETEWNIFGYDSYNLRVNFKEAQFIWSGNIIISPELDTSYVDYKSYDDEVILTWNSLPSEKYERQNIDNIIYNVKKTYQWLVNSLIPKVIFEIEKNKIQKTRIENFFRKDKTLSYENFILSYQPSKYILRDYSENYTFSVNDNEKSLLLQTINELHTFYKYEENVFVNIDNLIKIYEGVIYLLENGKIRSLSYLYGNLNDLEIKGDLSLNKFIQAIQNKIENLKQGTTNRFQLDLILRCYIVIIEDSVEKFTSSIISQIYEKLDGIIELKAFIEVRNRRLEVLK